MIRILRFLALALLGFGACDTEEGPPVPCSAALTDITLHVDESTGVSPCFTGEALPLTYEVTSTDPEVVSVSQGVSIELTAHKVGQALLSIRATDANGSYAEQSAVVDVPNRPPEIVEYPDLSRLALWSVHKFYLPDYIADRDGQDLVFRVIRSDSDKLHVSVSDDTLRVHALSRGRTEGFTIEATDTENDDVRIATAVDVSKPLFVITQGSHGRETDVPLMAGRQGLLRLFLTTDEFSLAKPVVTVTMKHRDGKVMNTQTVLGEGLIPVSADEGDLDTSINVFIDGIYIQKQVTVEVIIGKTRDPAIPQSIEVPLTVLEVPKLDLTMVPVVFGDNTAAVTEVARMVEQSGDHELLYQSLYALPVNEFAISGHEPIYISNDFDAQFETLHRVREVWEREGRRGIYMGIIPHTIGNAGLAGQAFTRGPRVAFGIMSNWVLAHELGHLFSLEHAPCGVVDIFGVDSNFPHHRGSIGIWGYNFQSGELFPPNHPDLMGYCEGEWISDYSFNKALLDRASTSDAREYQSRVMVVHGWIEADGNPNLLPSYYVTDTPSAISEGPYSVRLTSPNGELLSYSFAPDELADGPGGATFYHRIPVGWFSDELSGIELRAPSGAVAIVDEQTDQPYTIVMKDGRVVFSGQDVPSGIEGEVIFSRGIPRR